MAAAFFWSVKFLVQVPVSGAQMVAVLITHVFGDDPPPGGWYQDHIGFNGPAWEDDHTGSDPAVVPYAAPQYRSPGVSEQAIAVQGL